MKILRYKKFINENLEKHIIDDILSTNESKSNILDKIRKYSKKGLLTFSIVMNLLSNPVIANNQDIVSELKDISKTEYVIKKGDKYIAHGVGESGNFNVAKRKAISDALKNFLKETGKEEAQTSYKVVKEETTQSNNKYQVFISLEISY